MFGTKNKKMTKSATTISVIVAVVSITALGLTSGYTQQACSNRDIAIINTEIQQASTSILFSGRFDIYLHRMQQLALALSPRCAAALQALGSARGGGGYTGGNFSAPERVIDHGGGTFSVPGMGAVIEVVVLHTSIVGIRSNGMIAACRMLLFAIGERRSCSGTPYARF